MDILDTNAVSDQSAPWEPTGDITLQIEQGTGSVVDILGRVTEDAPWQNIKSIGPSNDRIMKISQVPWLKVMVRNPNQTQIRVWSNA